jgi:hypothetical protein
MRRIPYQYGRKAIQRSMERRRPELAVSERLLARSADVALKKGGSSNEKGTRA